MRVVPSLLLYVIAWITTSLVVTEIITSVRGDSRPFSTPTARVAEGPEGYAANVIMAEGFFGLLNGGLHLLLLSVLLRRLPQGRSLFLPSAVAGLLLGLICVGGWNGFLYAIMGHMSHPGIGQKIAVGLLPYLVSGAVAGCLRTKASL